MKIAIVGAGIAGNVVARALHAAHDITVYDEADHLGGHAHTHRLERFGRHYEVDTGFIVFNDRTYPRFVALLDELGVASQESSMSFSVRDEARDLEYNGTSLNASFAQRRNILNPAFLGMVRDIVRFNREAPRLLREAGAEVPLGALLEQGRYDAVFLACHSDQALGLLADPSASEREVLAAIGYQNNEAVLHTDVKMLPRRRLAWAAWNYHVVPHGHGPVALTYNMNILQNLESPEPFLVTLNRTDAIDPAKIIKRLQYHHPLFTPASVAAQARQAEVNRARHTYYCGAYWRNGFHEDGVVSALDALEHFHADIASDSWQAA